jgi:hypothetical protein
LKAVTIEDVPRHVLEILLYYWSFLSKIHSLSLDVDFVDFIVMNMMNVMISSLLFQFSTASLNYSRSIYELPVMLARIIQRYLVKTVLLCLFIKIYKLFQWLNVQENYWLNCWRMIIYHNYSIYALLFQSKWRIVNEDDQLYLFFYRLGFMPISTKSCQVQFH